MQTFFSLLKPPAFESSERKQFVFLANILSLLFGLLSLTLLVILSRLFGREPTFFMVLSVALLFFGVIALNRIGFTNAGRLLFCLVPVWMTMAITLWGKVTQPQQSYIVYFDSRFILLVTTVLPAIVFELKERLKIAVCLLSTFLCRALFDPIHNLFGLGYYQRGFDVASYYYINYVIFISFVGLLAAVFVLKWRDQKAADKLQVLLAQIRDANNELLNRNVKLENASMKIEAANEELQQQHEELHTSNEMLEQANQLIGKQRAKLLEYNLQLERLVKEKSADLVGTNEELVKSNNELRQFSFTVSHNLRGPVARLLGLTSLVRHAQNNEEVGELTGYIHQSAKELDSILKDLSQIIDIRNDLYRIRERIFIADEWNKALSLAGIHPDAAKLEVSFENAPYLYAIRPMIQSIFYNLISNAVKYRSYEREHVVRARSYLLHPDTTVIEISDNGLGIDLKSAGENLFRLYKRFHHHVPGKGLGLYLVKSQVEIQGGRIEIESAPEKGAMFRLIFPIPADVDMQVFFENDSAQLYYDANINNTVIRWKRHITSYEYRKVFDVVLQTIKTYNTPGWIADLRNQGTVAADDQQWFTHTILKAAHENGLVRVAAVGFHDPLRNDYYERMKNVTEELGIELRVFDSMEAAILWMKRFV